MKPSTAAVAAGILAVGLAGAAMPAQASLILSGAENFGGTGLGAVNTILTISSPGRTTSESGAVSYNGTSDIITGDALTGASQTRTRTISSLGLTSAADLRVVFNAVEPANANRSIRLDNLVLSIFSPTGVTLFSSGVFAPIFFADTETGAGNSGFVFALDAAQAAAAQAAGFGSGTNRIGLSAGASLAQGGFESFYVANSPSAPPPTPVPEPVSLALFGIGLAGLLAAGRKTARG